MYTCPVTQSRPTCDPLDYSLQFLYQAGILNGLPFPLPGDLPNPGSKPESPVLAGRFFITEPSEKPHLVSVYIYTDVYTYMYMYVDIYMGFPGNSAGKESTCNVGDPGSIPGLGRSPVGGHGNPLQYSCLENPQKQRSLTGCSP